MAVKVGESGKLLVSSFAGDDPMRCLTYVEQKLGVVWQPDAAEANGAAKAIDRMEKRAIRVNGHANGNAPGSQPVDDRQAFAIRLWSEAIDPRGTLVETYLRSRRLDLPDGVAMSVIRFHPSCPFGPGMRHPCMVAAFRSIETGAVVAIHRTALTADGRKLDRKMLGPVAGAAIMLGELDAERGCLTVGEGIESALSGLAMGFAPAWAMGSADAIAKLPVLRGVDSLTILGEIDGGASAKAIGQVGMAWSEGGREVLVATPKAGFGKDVNDALQKRSNGEDVLDVVEYETEPKGGSSIAEVIAEAETIETGTISQDALARIFANRYVDRLRYCHSSGSWFEWSGSHWEQDTKARAFNFVRCLGREMTEGSTPREIREVRKVTFAAGVERFAQGDQAFAVSMGDWDRDTFLLGTPGGTVDLRTGKLRQADPRDGITKLTSVAPADQADCPRWLQFLDEATGKDQGLIRFLQQWGGYCLTGDTREHALFFGYGPGGNGKSVLVNVFTGILADYAVTAAMDTFTASRGDKHPTELAMLRGARLATASETEEGKSWAEARIKSITGGDAVSARFMRQDFFTFMPTFKLLIVGNHKPVLHNVDEAARRRFNIVPFTRRPATPDRQLEGKLRAEWPGIFRWLIEGCLDWQANGLVRPESVRAATDSYFSDQDMFGQWLEEECDLEPGNPHKWATTTELFVSWADYAKAAGETAGGMRSFRDMLLRRDIEAFRNMNGRGFRGIQIKPKRAYGEAA
ncbi:phage/plasmid primase, P4 family [Bosea sp. PAMC 26642]|uniref:phage/plasmid primase, P4 family n=1 Tax=Bosea sp. (strain PAMC 26642) TaxID=1792307 RepID=UPI0007706A37|nr:phage/plasmid primase, P4 family [Bosea sp. PAMC 26642]AMJ61975.1 hypothetical protein AXW83_18215 [Bosea sp. PAMC 26642]